MSMDMGDIVFFLYQGKIYERRIRGILIPTILFNPDRGYTCDGKFIYLMGKEVVSKNSYLMCDDTNTPVRIDADKVFLTKEDLLESL